MTDKPAKITSISDLYDYYWMKSDLIKFCRNHDLSLQGAKLDLIKRIEFYLSSGQRIVSKPISKGKKDSLSHIAKNTLVKNYNNDAETRKFFIKHLGDKFKFNAYLRQFTNPDNIQPGMTYGDLIDGWIEFERNKSNSNGSHLIPPQFEYNQFIKDYFKNEKGATLKTAISAWKMIISKKGPRTYKQFKKDKNR